MIPSDQTIANPPAPVRHDAGDILASAFGMTVAMWGAAYLLRLPGAAAPLPVLAAAIIVALLAGGYLAGKSSSRGPRVGFLAGLLAGIINLLVLVSLARKGDRVDWSHAAWVPISPLISAALAGLGAVLGARRRDASRAYWPRTFATVACISTLFLLAVGGAVTGQGAGLAVTDWPNTFGNLMFLYPIADMPGGVYFEHSHRLIAFLVGLTTLSFAVYVTFAEPRRLVRGLAWLAVLTVVAQGVLGGLRVTGIFTWSTDPSDVRPNIVYAVAHGVLAQLFFCLLVGIRTILSTRPDEPMHRAAANRLATDRLASALLVILIVVQVLLGAVARHTNTALTSHMAFAAIVGPLAILVGLRAAIKFARVGWLRRIATHLLAIVMLQVGLGFWAWIVRGELPNRGDTWHVIITTAHQTTGAVLLANALILAIVLRRFATDSAQTAAAGVEFERSIASARGS